MQVFVKVLDGRSIPLMIGRGEPIESLKAKLACYEGVPELEQRLIFAGRQLVDSATPMDANMQSGATVHMTLRLRGGIFVEACEILWSTLKTIFNWVRTAWNFVFGQRCCKPPPDPRPGAIPKRGPCWCNVDDEDGNESVRI